MGKYLDFENVRYEKGFKSFQLFRDNIKANIGKKICYVVKRDVCKYRGTYQVRYGVIHSLRYSQLYLSEDMSQQIDIRDILECGIKIDDE